MDHYLIHPLPNPNTLEDLVPKYLRMWHNLPNYSRQEIILKDLFRRYPHNDNEEEVMAKLVTLNEFYSTNVGAKGKIARHISSIQHLDDLLQSGDILIINKIKKADDVNRNFLSFASKYASFHNPKAYPIFDSFVADVLSYYQNNYFFLGTTEHLSPEKLRTSPYEKFYEVINKFKDTYIQKPYTFKELDRFLWQFGKEYFVNYRLALLDNYVVEKLDSNKLKEIFVYKLCIELNENGNGNQNSYANVHYGIFNALEKESHVNLLETHCKYISRKDGIIGEYYIEVDDVKNFIRIYRRIYKNTINIKDQPKVEEVEKNEKQELAKYLTRIAEEKSYSVNGSDIQNICQIIIDDEYSRRKERAKEEENERKKNINNFFSFVKARTKKVIQQNSLTLSTFYCNCIGVYLNGDENLTICQVKNLFAEDMTFEYVDEEGKTINKIISSMEDIKEFTDAIVARVKTLCEAKEHNVSNEK